MKKYKTIFCDIDGTIFKYRPFESYEVHEAQLTPGTAARLTQWKAEGHMIVLTTARPESLREYTHAELKKHAIPWDQLVMGIERGPRYLINDESPSRAGPRATAISLKRDEGLWDVCLESTVKKEEDEDEEEK